MSVTDIPNFDRLSDLERLELAKEIIASVRHQDTFRVSTAHRLEFEWRWVEFERNPTSGLSEKEFWERAHRCNT